MVASLLSVWLLGSTKASQRCIGAFTGMTAQPLWFIAGIASGNWALMLLSPVFAGLYYRALRNHMKG